MRRLLLAAPVVLLLASAPAHSGVHWLCGLSAAATQLVCLADIDPRAAAAAEPAETTAVVNGTRFPLDARRIYTVDFWSPATDLAFVDSLAQATLCYRSSDCEVTFTVQPERTAYRSLPVRQ